METLLEASKERFSSHVASAAGTASAANPSIWDGSEATAVTAATRAAAMPFLNENVCFKIDPPHIQPPVI